MKQKSFIKNISLIKRIGSLIEHNHRIAMLKMAHDDHGLDESHAGFKVIETYQNYLNLANKGLITEELEIDLHEKVFDIGSINFPKGDDSYSQFRIGNALPCALELCSYYCAMSITFLSQKRVHQATAYAMKAFEASGMITQISLLSNLSSSYQESSMEISNEVQSLTRKNKSIRANIKKTDAHLAKEAFARQKWVELTAWHQRTAKDTADKLIKEFSKSVPAKDKLARLISEWKQQSKK